MKLGLKQSGIISPQLVGIVLIVIVIIAVGVFVLSHKKSDLSSNPSACVNQTFASGSSGACVSDIQNLVNWTNYGIDQPDYLKVTGSYDATLTSAVDKLQSSANLSVTGKIDTASWKVLCQSEDPPTWWTKAATDAGCIS